MRYTGLRRHDGLWISEVGITSNEGFGVWRATDCQLVWLESSDGMFRALAEDGNFTKLRKWDGDE